MCIYDSMCVCVCVCVCVVCISALCVSVLHVYLWCMCVSFLWLSAVCEGCVCVCLWCVHVLYVFEVSVCKFFVSGVCVWLLCISMVCGYLQSLSVWGCVCEVCKFCGVFSCEFCVCVVGACLQGVCVRPVCVCRVRVSSTCVSPGCACGCICRQYQKVNKNLSSGVREAWVRFLTFHIAVHPKQIVQLLDFYFFYPLENLHLVLMGHMRVI